MICFSKERVVVIDILNGKYKKEIFSDHIYKQNDKSFTLVIPSTFANIEFSINEDQSISTTDPQAIGRKIRYIKISSEEAESLLK